ncbi:hypothetical protein [Mucilaginibacter sp.]|uniref:hypothetical protein n=1 Tax=Mucilaginibacter sp. TaxID=1882438 RepID=UPI003265BC32
MENQYPYEELILNLLSLHLSNYKEMGSSLREAIKAFNLSAGEQNANRFGAGLNWQEQVRVERLVEVVSAYYEHSTAQELAIELKEDFRYDAPHVIKGVLTQFRMLKASELCGIMLHPQVCPEFAGEPLGMGKLIKANPVVSYDEQDLLAALTLNYPKLPPDEAAEYVNQIFGRKKKDPIAALAGTYVTDAKWWGAYFSPLVIREDGAVTLGLVPIRYTYNDDTKKLRFEHEVSPGTNCWGDVTFAAGGRSFKGGIQPRPQDGGVDFEGNRQ